MPPRARASFCVFCSIGLDQIIIATCAFDNGASELANHVIQTVPAGDIAQALASFDELSRKRRFGMHLGTEKGELIELAVAKGVSSGYFPHMSKKPVFVLETGCHAGDGTLRAIAAMGQARDSTSKISEREKKKSRIVSTEDNEKWLAAAKTLVPHAAKNSNIDFIPLELAEDSDFGEFLDSVKNEHGIDQFTTVILDQDQRQFKKQAELLLEKNMLRPGATLYVDNVKTKRNLLKQYLDFVEDGAGQFETHYYEIHKPYADAVAISTYRGLDQLDSEKARGSANTDL
eukprot:TRINITY_DN50732_c0_g1_i1.p1 TRINITY_DN50732_c0_g1~~TRINITY_DN50732_c0_g1_i1.p1  ORF type:complete len:288 (+),score=38.76 TRINITY_DN50732_c0_g1_i1:46-909(+)